MKNIFTLNPQWGDAVVGNLTTKKVEYIKADSFDADSLPSNYETIGAVFCRRGKAVTTLWKNCPDSEKLSERYEWKLTGYTLDGTDRSGVLSIRESSSASANVEYTVSYNATTAEGLVATLNAFFAATAIFTSQNWFAWLDGEDIHIGHDYTYWQQASYNKGASGFALTAAFLPEWYARSTMLAKCGAMYYPIINQDRGYAYFHSDNSSSAYNPTSVLTKPIYSYPICLPGYLGTSQYRDKDCCAVLREKYGEGEEGWLRYMRSTQVLPNTDRLAGGFHDGKSLTTLLAKQRYTLSDGQERITSPAANKAMTQPTSEVLTDWFLPTIEDLAEGIRGIKYGTSASRDADKLNQTLWRMGGSALSNGTNYWSCVRGYSSNAWNFDGYYGFAYYNLFVYRYRVLSLSLNYLP